MQPVDGCNLTLGPGVLTLTLTLTLVLTITLTRLQSLEIKILESFLFATSLDACTAMVIGHQSDVDRYTGARTG